MNAVFVLGVVVPLLWVSKKQHGHREKTVSAHQKFHLLRLDGVSSRCDENFVKMLRSLGRLALVAVDHSGE